MDNLKIKKGKDSDVLVFSNKVLKEDIRDLKKSLLESIDRSKKIFIEFDNLNKTDMFFVQLLCAAHKYAFKNNKKIEFSKEIPESLEHILENNGFYREKGCLDKNEDDCFWIKEVTSV